ncbi:choline transporter, partial [Brevibacterium paucivorans]
ERQRLLGRAQALTEHVREAVVDDLSEGGLVPDEDWSDRMRREWEESLDNRIDYRIERTAPALLPMRKKNPPQSED